jgi:chromosomal replication initiation ATPase DnaA
MEKTIILTGPQGSGKTYLSEIIQNFFLDKKVIKTDFHEIGYMTTVYILRSDLVIIEEVSEKDLLELLKRFDKLVPYLKRTNIIIICSSIPKLPKAYKYTEIKCTYN